MESLSLLDLDPGLGAGLGKRQRRAIRKALRVPVVRLRPGSWEPPDEGWRDVGYLLSAGMLLRRVKLAGGRSVELLGPGDCLFPGREDSVSFSTSEWHVVDSARLAVLDIRVGAPLSRSPLVTTELIGRTIDRSRALAAQSAIMSIVGIESRLVALLWALAERWGRTVSGGAELEVNVPQGVLAEMVGARRPTVSQALGSLSEQGVASFSEPGKWVLRGEAPALEE